MPASRSSSGAPTGASQPVCACVPAVGPLGSSGSSSCVRFGANTEPAPAASAARGQLRPSRTASATYPLSGQRRTLGSANWSEPSDTIGSSWPPIGLARRLSRCCRLQLRNLRSVWPNGRRDNATIANRLLSGRSHPPPDVYLPTGGQPSVDSYSIPSSVQLTSGQLPPPALIIHSSKPTVSPTGQANWWARSRERRNNTLDFILPRALHARRRSVRPSIHQAVGRPAQSGRHFCPACL